MDLIKYIEEITGLKAVIFDSKRKDLINLPLYLQKASGYKILLMNGRELLIEYMDNNITPNSLAKRRDLLEKYFSKPVVFVFNRLESFQRKRLIKKKISFIVPYKQMYIPALFIDLRELREQENIKKDKLSPVSQVLLLYHLECENLENISFSEISERIKYSKISITRAVNELVQLGLCVVSGKKEKVLNFTAHKKELWNKSLGYLSSPVRRIIFADNISSVTKLFKSNVSALENYSNISGGRPIGFAVFFSEFQKLKKLKDIPEANNISGEYRIEVWNYNPAILSKLNFVDPLSLYLTMSDFEDERIQLALQEMMKSIKW